MKKILIVEDNAVTARAYLTKLQLEGFVADVASDGEAALRMAQQSPPDLILLDLMLPKVQGVEVLRTLRALPQFHDLPVIVFTQTYAPLPVQEAWKAGATQVLLKSTSTPKQVVEAVKGQLAAPRQ